MPSLGGRKLLSRVELSSDRKSVTLFYLEPLPASARVRVTFDGNGLTDFLGRPIDADGDSAVGGVATIDFDTLSVTAGAGTAVSGRMFASEVLPASAGVTGSTNRPLTGVTITVDGKEETLRTVTDAQGNFRLEPAPVGKFFVLVDGRTATNGVPPGAYYPFVGKAWEGVAGQVVPVNGTGEIYLPLIIAGTLQPVSPVADTKITFPPSVISTNPALAGVEVTVPANALFSDEGTRGGKVGIAPVAPDRLPEPLPAGLNFPLVITIQTDGPRNFDRPVPVRFPNLPDPKTGETLPPSAKSALWSFNHDTGRWEIQGLMTVTADGKYVESDPGVGVKQPGWHGTQPGSEGEGGAGVLNSAARAQKAARPAVQKGLSGLGNLVAAVTSAASAATRVTVPLGPLSVIGLAVDAAGCRGGDQRACLKLGLDVLGLVPIPVVSVSAAVVSAALNGWDMGPDFQQMGEAMSEGLKEVQKGVDGEPSPQSLSAKPSNVAELDAFAKKFDKMVDQSLSELSLQLPVWTRLAAVSRRIEPMLVKLNTNDSASLGLPAVQLQAFLNDSLILADDLVFLADRPALADLVLQTAATYSTVMGKIGDKLTQPATIAAYALLENLDDDSGVVERFRLSAQGRFSRILRPDSFYRVTVVDPLTLQIGLAVFRSPPNGLRQELPLLVFVPSQAPDSDNDGLADDVEVAIGTDPKKPDTDRDGILDGAELQQGTDPLTNLAVRTGVIATAEAPGTPVDLCVNNDIAVLACAEAGVTVYNVSSGLNPTRIAQVKTINAVAIACSGSLIAVADGNAGLAVIDITDPPAARVVRQINLGAAAQAVAIAANVAYMGLNSGQLVLVDMLSGTVLDRVNLGGPAHDLTFGDDNLFVLLATELRAYRFGETGLEFAGSAATSNFSAEGITQRKRLFVGGGYALATCFPGYDTFDVRDASAIRRVGSAVDRGPNSFKQIVANGSGLGIAAVGVNPRDDGTHGISLYDLSDPAVTTNFIAAFATPGIARAVAINNGLAYVADGARRSVGAPNGLQVVNYLAYDNKGVPPTIKISTSAKTNVFEEGKMMRVTADVTDDVQVRNVVFYVDGALASSDGNFPFEYRFLSPAIKTNKTSIQLRARAVDTGGNDAWSDELTINLVHDATPPRVTRAFPAPKAIVGSVDTVGVYFSEPMDPLTLDNKLCVLPDL